jgi:hypothetical protein
MTDTKLQKAREAAAKAQRELEALEAAEAERAAKLAAEREERAREYSRDFLANWQELAREATKTERPTMDYDPVALGFLEGLIQFAASREKRRHVLQFAQDAESTLGVPSNMTTIPSNDRPYEIDVVSVLQQVVRREAGRRAAEFADELAAKREAFINGKA